PKPHLLNNSAAPTSIIHGRKEVTPSAPCHFSTKNTKTKNTLRRHCIIAGGLDPSNIFGQQALKLGIRRMSQSTYLWVPPPEPRVVLHQPGADHRRFVVGQRPPHAPVPARFPRTSGRHGRHAQHPSAPCPLLPLK
ncbi:hypothetical protein CORC01_05170, partial [Colletotrichum orchidophilum]